MAGPLKRVLQWSGIATIIEESPRASQRSGTLLQANKKEQGTKISIITLCQSKKLFHILLSSIF